MSERVWTVLVIDDEPSNIDLLKGVLPEGFKVKAAISGEKGIKVAQKPPPPDLIFLDVMMPEMDGWEVCRQLKADAATAGIPVVFLSGHSGEAERARGLALGAVEFISKPIDPLAVQAVVRKYCA